MSDYKLTFERVVPNTDLAQFHNNIVLNFKAFYCQPLQFPDRPGEHHYIYSVAKRYHDPEIVSKLEIISTVIADQTRIGEVHLSIHVRYDKFIEPFSNWLLAEYGVSLMTEAAATAAESTKQPRITPLELLSKKQQRDIKRVQTIIYRKNSLGKTWAELCKGEKTTYSTFRRHWEKYADYIK